MSDIEPFRELCGVVVPIRPFYWPTRRRMRALLEAAGFVVEAQRRVYPIPAGLLFPPVPTIAVRPRV
jgi:hypothetical protein